MSLYIFYMWKSICILPMLALAIHSQCVHDEFARNTTKYFYNDLSDGRLLAENEIGRIRVFVDYTQVTVGGQTEINTIKRVTNITASYFYNVLNVTRLGRLYYPANTPLQCNTLRIPQKYVSEGAIGDVGVVCGNENSPGAVFVAKSTPCAFLTSNKRPIWGMMSWNNAFLKFDQQGFQQILFVGIHELTHILGFSAMMYELYPLGNPLVQTPNGDNFLNSSKIFEQIKKHFKCDLAKGLPLEEQDGTLIASHWQRKVLGNQYMIASNKKGSFMSRFTLALFESTGWYNSVNYKYAEPTIWGKNKGCDFLNIDNCDSEQFCQDSSFGCDWEATAIGKCSIDAFSGACKIYKYFTNTVCVDENYELKNLNSKLNGMERGGSNSRCFNSDYRQEGLQKTKLDNRCYVSICSHTGKFIYVLVGTFILVCRNPGQQIQAPPGLDGILTCPRTFDNYCSNKKTCPYHCNKNGACINGECLCAGSTELTPTCIDISIFNSSIGSTGGLLNALNDNNRNLIMGNMENMENMENDQAFPEVGTKQKLVKYYSLNSKCIEGTTFDTVFGECLKCKQVYNCQNCDDNGCLSCDDGRTPLNKHCSFN